MANPAIDTDFQIGLTLGGLATLQSIGVVNPHPIWSPAVSVAKLGDGSAALRGSPFVVWGWGFISAAERDILKSYCPALSSSVYIYTPTTENSGGVQNVSKRYQGIMIWPSPEKPEDPQTGRRLEFSIVIRQLIEI
jgi:hypothetical protein